METNKLFIWGLSQNIKWENLKEICEDYGKVLKVNIIKDRETHESRWFWFVEFSSSKEATAAMEAMNWGELDWKTLNINYAQERK